MPIDIATGDVDLTREDFALPGRVPLKWTRYYRHSLLTADYSQLGRGWTTSWLPALRRTAHSWNFRSREGEIHTFLDSEGRVENGVGIRLFGAYVELAREDSHFVVTQWNPESEDIWRYVFRAVGPGGTTVLLRVENVSGDSVDVVNDKADRLSALHQRLEGRTVAVNYLPSGKIGSLMLVTKTGENAELVRYEYDGVGQLSAAIDPRGLANRYEYDADYRLTREILRDGAVYSYRYDEQGRCIRFSGLDRYNEKRLRFLDATRTTIVTNSEGKSTIYRHLPTGQIVGEVDAYGNERRTTFDECNRIVAKVDPTGGTIRYSYDEYGNRDSVTDPLGNVYRFTFNTRHQPLTVTNPLGKAWTREYDAKHRLVSWKDPLGARWTISYDDLGNLAVITDPLGSRRHQRFGDGLLLEKTDCMGQVIRYEWDCFGRLVERVDATGAHTSYRL